ncbi:hypothetical protein bcgnr5375_54790 [Bacillus cereus]
MPYFLPKNVYTYFYTSSGYRLIDKVRQKKFFIYPRNIKIELAITSSKIQILQI